jgi:surfactin synthase thioesterase subunit
MFFVREWNKQMERKLQVFHLFTAKDFKDLSTIISLEDSTKLEVENKNIKANIAQEAIWYEIQDQDSSLFNLPHFIEIPPEYQNIKELVTETLRHCEPLFSKFELTNTGDLNQILIDSSKYEIEEKALTISAYNEFKKEAFFRKINLSNGPCFEAAILNVEDKKLVYFNPHHIVYDGGSDEVLSGVFHSVLNRLSVVGNKLTRQAPAINVSWKNYFQLSENPIPLSGKALMKIEENYRIMLPSTTTSHILKIQQKWKCSQSAVYATLIGEGLKAISKPTNWVSLVVDTREEAVMGMFMRAFPIPTNAENIALNISQTKAALEFVFKHKNNVIIYPKGVEQKLYHQVGLVIQHPLELAEDIRTVHDDFSRARLPLTLYVERVNSQTFFRWEFDSGYFSLEEIKNLQNHVDSIIEKLADLEVQEFEPIQLEEELNELGKIRNDGIARTIWEKYLGKNADNDFFVSGGNSLKALMLLNEIRNITGKSIPPARFLKNPTFNFLSNEITKVDSISEQLWVMSEGEEGEDWYLPPIFGLALIYNTYSIRQKHYSVSFNYPAAINSKQSYFSITELAEVLLSNYLKEHTLPPKIDRIVAYSMGGLVGFELIKLLEEKGVQVAEFVIWDKSAQKNKPKNSLMSDIKLADDLLHYVEQLASDEDSKQEIINYLIKHQYLIESYHQKGEINTDIQLKYCAKGFTQDELTDWGLFTSKTFLMEQLPAEVTHYEIPKYWK